MLAGRGREHMGEDRRIVDDVAGAQVNHPPGDDVGRIGRVADGGNRYRIPVEAHFEPVGGVCGGHQEADGAGTLRISGPARADPANPDPGSVSIRRRVALPGQDDGQIGTLHARVGPARAGIPIGVQHDLDRTGYPLRSDGMSEVDEEVEIARVILDGDRAQVDGRAGWDVAERVGNGRRNAVPVGEPAVGPDGGALTGVGSRGWCRQTAVMRAVNAVTAGT